MGLLSKKSPFSGLLGPVHRGEKTGKTRLKNGFLKFGHLPQRFGHLVPRPTSFFFGKKSRKKRGVVGSVGRFYFENRRSRAPDRPWAFHAAFPPLVVYRGTFFLSSICDGFLHFSGHFLEPGQMPKIGHISQICLQILTQTSIYDPKL